jgi:hypothetical protein
VKEPDAPPQRLPKIIVHALAVKVHVTQPELRFIQPLRRSQPVHHQRCGVVSQCSAQAIPMQKAGGTLTIAATGSSARERKLHRTRLVPRATVALQVAEGKHACAAGAALARA